MSISTYKWAIDSYHQAVEAGIFNDQSVELLNGEIKEHVKLIDWLLQ